MRKLLSLLILSAAAASAQTAAFPSAVATDSQLRVAANNVQTTLSFPMLAADTTINIVNATGIVANSIITIDNENIAVCGVSGNQLTAGKSSCPNVDGRGFDGSSASPHANGAAVYMNIDAWHHNAVKEELKAIEAALGVGLANVVALIPNPTPVNKGGTGATTPSGARANLGAAAAGANGDITSLTNLTTPLPVNEGGTGATTQPGALSAVLGGAPLPVANGGTGATTQSGALSAVLGGAALPIANGGTGATSNAGFRAGFSLAAYVPDYGFSAQSPAGTISAGNTTITLSPVPRGVNWNDALSGTGNDHYLWIAGTGTPEACYIVTLGPGTATSNAASGTVTLHCAGSHAAGFTVASATGGLQEALVANAGGRIQLPCSPMHVKAATTFAKAVVYELFGCGQDQNSSQSSILINDDTTGLVSTLIIPDHSTGGTYQQSIYLHDFKMTCNTIHTCGTHLQVVNYLGLFVERLFVQYSAKDGMYCTRCNIVHIKDSTFFNNNLSGATFDEAANQAVISGNTFIGNSVATGAGGLRFKATNTSNSSLGPLVIGNDFESQDYGLLMFYVAGATITGNRWETHSTRSLYAANGVSGTLFQGNYNLAGRVDFDAGSTNTTIGPNTWDGSGGLTSVAGQTIFTGRQNYSAAVAFSGFIAPLPAGTASASGGAATLNAQQGTITTESLSTATGAIYTLTLTNSMVGAASVVTGSVQLGGATTGTPQIVSIAPGSGSVVIKVKNIDGTNAFNGTLKVSFSVSNVN